MKPIPGWLDGARRCWRVLALVALVTSATVAEPPPALAQETDAESAAPAETEPAAAEADESEAPTLESVDSKAQTALVAGNTAWMLTSSALVLFMTAPGLAMFYGGLVRKKNVLSVMMQCVFLMGMMTVVWGLYGYSLAFGDNDNAKVNPYVGGDDYLFMKGVGRTWDDEAKAPVETMYPNEEGSLPLLAHMLFQGMFFIITPALICGAFAERMKFSAMVAFLLLWGTLVYCPLCHWVWDAGILGFAKTADIEAGTSAGLAFYFISRDSRGGGQGGAER